MQSIHKTTGAVDLVVTGGSVQAPSTLTVGASPYAYTQIGEPAMVYVAGGTVTAITITRGNNAAITTGLLSGSFKLSPNDILTVTYTAAPTMIVMPE